MLPSKSAPSSLHLRMRFVANVWRNEYGTGLGPGEPVSPARSRQDLKARFMLCHDQQESPSRLGKNACRPGSSASMRSL